MANEPITVMLVDDHPVVRDGYRKLLDNQPDISVVAELDDGESAYLQYPKVKPDVVVLDLNMPGKGGLETIHRILAKDSKAQILVFSMHDSKFMISRALEAGARGYLIKSSSAEEMVNAVRDIFSGKIYLDQEISADFKKTALSDSDLVGQLTKREFQVFCALAEGKSVSEIARIISISPKTVGVHQTNLMKKLHLKNISELTHLAIRSGVVVA